MLYVSTSNGFRPAEDHHVLQAGAETARRKFDERSVDLRSRGEAEAYLIPLMATKKYEVSCVAFLDCAGKLIVFEEIGAGSIGVCPMPPRRVAQRALELNAGAVIIVHNHPMGGNEPSNEDINITVRMKMLLEQLDIVLLEHYVVSAAGVTAISVEYGKRMEEQESSFSIEMLKKLLKIPEAG